MAPNEFTALHPSLQQFSPVEELMLHGGQRTLLATSKAGSRVVIEIMTEGAIPADTGAALAKAASGSARLSHEAIVQARAFVLEADVAAVVSEFVPGVSLQRLIRFAVGRGVRLPDDVGWSIVSRVVSALANAHGAKDVKGNVAPVVHGGPRPEVVVVGWNGAAKLGDFGGAKMRSLVAPLLKEPRDLVELVAPEVARGGERTEKSDIYEAALLALRVATGRTPYARHRESRATMMIAMSEGVASRFAKVRPDLPEAVRVAFDRALEPDPEKRTVTAQELATAIKDSFDLAKGKEAISALLARWRDGLEKGVTPWEKRGSMSDREADGDTHEAALTLATADERPSGPMLVSADDVVPKSQRDPVPPEEMALPPTEARASMSRVGASASDALSMPPLPPMRIQVPSVPVYGGPAVNLPRTTAQPTNGRAMAFAMLFLFVVIVVGAVLLFKFLGGPTTPP